MKPDYSKTYWNNNGKYPEIAARLNAMIPREGEVLAADENPALEKFRHASNCYYDLYNNGLCNRADEFERIFGVKFNRDDETDEIEEPIEITQELINLTEKAMNAFIKAAIKEQESPESFAERERRTR